MSDEQKKQAAEAAIAYIEPGMRLGLGTGSTAAWFVRALGREVAAGLDIVGVPTSLATEQLAKTLGIPLTSLDEETRLDITVDGADEIGPQLALIKGGGGALLREKIVAAASDRMIVIADHTKHVEWLGTYPLPIEVIAFGLGSTKIALTMAAAEIGLSGSFSIRMAGETEFRTDSGNLILDASFGRIPEPEALADRLNRIPGIVEHGLFLNMASIALIAGPETVETISA